MAEPISVEKRALVQRTLKMGVLNHKEAIETLPAYESALQAAEAKIAERDRLLSEAGRLNSRRETETDGADRLIAELQEALKPFAAVAGKISVGRHDAGIAAYVDPDVVAKRETPNITVGDLRRARAALSSTADRGESGNEG